MKSLLAARRLLAGLWHLVWGWWVIHRTFAALTPEQRHAHVVQWSREFLRLLGIHFQVQGAPHAGPVLMVANHISWVDIPVLHASCFCRFVSKSDVRHWPVVGSLAAMVDTLFIERRSKRDAMRVVHDMAQSLRQGDVLTVFPEGTTSDGRGVLPFHANLLQAAISANAPVQPVCIYFADRNTGQFSTVASYVGDDWLLTAVWRTLRSNSVSVTVCFGVPQYAQGRDRRAWAADLRAAVLALRPDSAAVGRGD